MPVSVVTIVKNESSRLKDCLDCVHDWAKEIVIVDDESTDNTREIAAKYTDKIFIRKMDIEGRHRNWAYSKASCDWVLTVDADERITDDLKREIEEAIQDKHFTHFSIPYKNHIGNYLLTADVGRGIVRLFQKDKFKYEEVEVHPRIIKEGPCGHLKTPVIHYSYRDFGDFLSKLNNQTTLEAKKWINLSKVDPKKANYKMNLFHALWRTMDRFIRTFIGRRGYRDGFIGFMFSFFASLYQIISYAKYWEMKKKL